MKTKPFKTIFFRHGGKKAQKHAKKHSHPPNDNPSELYCGVATTVKGLEKIAQNIGSLQTLK